MLVKTWIRFGSNFQKQCHGPLYITSARTQGSSKRTTRCEPGLIKRPFRGPEIRYRVPASIGMAANWAVPDSGLLSWPPADSAAGIWSMLVLRAWTTRALRQWSRSGRDIPPNP
ncbi:hypothetical protein RRG08_045992 [Elysia crispata]|uniref:Uncharacterized protein n=1 Tax=Elysia crispata TaxID=231223 RepID=A0AAE0Z1F1_9GAST|nr:hypothetical protein RRG08_045992 [Elysia crispata]